MKTALVIMAAGIGSRYGGGVKQLAPVGPGGEIIMDYSVHDAIRAGFNKIIFIIRRDIEADFREVIGDRMEKLCGAHGVEVAYTFQELSDLPSGHQVPPDRKKPWGTGQAVLACRGMIHEPFCVINADDYYGREAFGAIHEYLLHYSPERPADFCMAGFILKNTLSDFGTVTRGICEVDAHGFLTNVTETHDIVKTAAGAETGGRPLDVNNHVSMNMWGLTPEFMDTLERGFENFLAGLERDAGSDRLKAEYLIPVFIGQLLQEKKVTVKVLETRDRWFGVTYQEDRPAVARAFGQMIAEGVYRTELFSDL